VILYLVQKLATCLLAKYISLSDDGIRKPKAIYDILLKKLDYVLSPDIKE